MANKTAQVTETKLSSPVERKNRVGVDAAASDLPLGIIVGRDSSGYYTHADDTQPLTEVGINVSPTQRVDSTLDDGTYKCDVVSGVVAAFKIATMGDDASARSHYGEPVFALYNDEVSLSRGANGNFVGYLIGHKSVTVALVMIPTHPPEYESLAQMDDDIEERFLFVERWLKLPGLNADFAVQYSENWELYGQNMTSALATFAAGGGLLLTLAGGNNDNVILWPNQQTKQSALEGITWDPDDELHFEALIVAPTISAASAARLAVGLRLSISDNPATDDDKATFFYQYGTPDNYWHTLDSTGGTDNNQITAVEVESDAVYRLRIIVDSSRVPRYYINGVLVATGEALTAGVDLKPFFGMAGMDTPAAAHAANIRYIVASKRYA